MSFRQTGSTWVTQRCWSIEAVMISFYYHNVDTNFLRHSVFLLDFLMYFIIYDSGPTTTRIYIAA